MSTARNGRTVLCSSTFTPQRSKALLTHQPPQKHQQGEYEFAFKGIKGIILISTNANPSKLFRNCSALVDRFVLITHAPRNGEADPTLENALLEQSVQITHWSLGTPQTYFDRFVRTGSMNESFSDDANHLQNFVLHNLGYRANHTVLQRDLYSHYVDAFSDTAKLYNERGFCKEVSNVIKLSTRCRAVNDGRATDTDGRKVAAIKNVCLVAKDGSACTSLKDSEYCVQNLAIKRASQTHTALDPLSIDLRHVTYPVANAWRGSVGSVLDGLAPDSLSIIPSAGGVLRATLFGKTHVITNG